MKEFEQQIKAAEKKMPYPGDPISRQPVHTLYGGAHLFKLDTIEKLGREAMSVFKLYAPEAKDLEKVWTLSDPTLWRSVHERVAKKLREEAVEDFRIDFEDGYGPRPDAEEDRHAEQAALALTDSKLPPFIGIRIKPFTSVSFKRSVRTLEIFLKNVKSVPPNFVVTLPKVTFVEQVKTLVKVFERLEKKLKCSKLHFEFMVETPQSMLGPDGASPLLSFVKAGKGRCVGAHLGTYDYTASHNIIAAHQNMLHPACDFAKQMMKVALTQTGVFLSDGATNVMPIRPHRADNLSPQQIKENSEAVLDAWRISFKAIRHSLETGFYQGWDLHPAQLPIRYAAIYSFFLESLAISTERLRGFVERAARATLLGNVFDDAATGQGLLNFFLRGRSCGALNESELLATGLTTGELELRNFQLILEQRAK